MLLIEIRMTSLQKHFNGINFFLPGHGRVNASSDEGLVTVLQEFLELNTKGGPHLRKVPLFDNRVGVQL